MMTPMEYEDITVELRQLHLSVTDTLEMNMKHPSGQIEHLLLFLDAAQAYSTILARCEAAVYTVPDGYYTTLYDAARVGGLLLSATCDARDDDVTKVGFAKSACDYVIEGIERFSLLLPSGKLLETHTHEEILRMVSLLWHAAAQWQSQERVIMSSAPTAIHGDDSSLPSHRHRMRIDKYLHCTRTLIEQGSFSCRDAEQLLSSSSPSYGGVLHRFLLHTLQEEFTLMRHLTSDARIASGTDGVGEVHVTNLSDKCRNCLSSNGFYYYAPLPLMSKNNSVRHGQSTSTASVFLTGCKTPHSHHAGEEHGWLLGHSDCGRNAALNRHKCKHSASVELTMTVLLLLGTRANSLRDQYDNTSDFVDFIGDLVSVCAIVVLPFLTEQLEYLELLQQQMSCHSNLQETQSILHHVSEDMVKYRKYVNVVENFLFCWDTSFIKSHIPPALPTDTSLFSPLGLVVNEDGKKDECNTEKSAATLSAASLTVVATTMTETKQNGEPQWESVAPSLAAYFASSTHSSTTIPWSQFESLAAEMKHFRETELVMMWSHWVRIRGETSALANEVVRMQKRCEVLLELKTLLLPQSGATVVDLQQKWEGQLKQRERDLGEALANS